MHRLTAFILLFIVLLCLSSGEARRMKKRKSSIDERALDELSHTRTSYHDGYSKSSRHRRFRQQKEPGDQDMQEKGLRHLVG
nr:expressed protein [Hymenolepis microstoma]